MALRKRNNEDESAAISTEEHEKALLELIRIAQEECFEDELTSFTLSLTNPSTQADLLKVENWQTKVQLYRDAVSDPGNGIQAVSSSWAKKHILGFSDDEIKLDISSNKLYADKDNFVIFTGQLIMSDNY